MADLLSAISVLLVFLTFLFNSIEKEVSDALDLRKPEKAQTDKRKKYTNSLYHLLFMKVLPIALIYLLTAYALLPKFIKILRASKIDFWDFNELNTIFVFIVLGLMGLTLYAITKTIKIIKKIKE